MSYDNYLFALVEEPNQGRFLNLTQLQYDMKHGSTIHRSFSFESFLKQLSENVNNIFKEPKQRNWLKIDLVTAEDSWQQLFQDHNMEKRGEVYYLQMSVYEKVTPVLISHHIVAKQIW